LDRTPQRLRLDSYPEERGLLFAGVVLVLVVGPAVLFTTPVVVAWHELGVLGRPLALWTLLVVCSSLLDLFGEGLADDLVECLAVHIAKRSLQRRDRGHDNEPCARAAAAVQAQA